MSIIDQAEQLLMTGERASNVPLKPGDAPGADDSMGQGLDNINTKLRDMAKHVSDPHVSGLLTALGATGLGGVTATTGSYLVDNLTKANIELKEMRHQAQEFQHIMGGAGAAGLGGHVGTGQIMGQSKTMEMMLGISQRETQSFAADSMKRGLTSDWETAVGKPGEEYKGMMFQTEKLSADTGMASPEIMGIYSNLKDLYGITGTDLPDAFATLNLSAINAGQGITEFTNNFVGLSRKTRYLGVSFDDNIALLTRFGKRLEEGSMSLESLARLTGASIGGGGLGSGLGLLSMVGENIAKGIGGSSSLQEKMGGLTGVHRGMALDQMLRGENTSKEDRATAVGATVEVVRGMAAGAAGLTSDQGREILEAKGKFENLSPDSGISGDAFVEFRSNFASLLKSQGISAEKTYEANEEWALVAEDMKDSDTLYREAVVGHREASEAMLSAATKLSDGKWEDAFVEMVSEYRDSIPLLTKIGEVMDQLFMMGMIELDKMVYLLEIIASPEGVREMLLGGKDPMESYYESERGEAYTEMAMTMAQSYMGNAATMANAGQMDPMMGMVAGAWGAYVGDKDQFHMSDAERAKFEEDQTSVRYADKIKKNKEALEHEREMDMLVPREEGFAIGGYVMGDYPGQPKKITAHVGEYVSPPETIGSSGSQKVIAPLTLNYYGSGSREDAEDFGDKVWDVVSDKFREIENSNEAGKAL